MEKSILCRHFFYVVHTLFTFYASLKPPRLEKAMIAVIEKLVKSEIMMSGFCKGIPFCNAKIFQKNVFFLRKLLDIFSDRC